MGVGLEVGVEVGVALEEGVEISMTTRAQAGLEPAVGDMGSRRRTTWFPEPRTVCGGGGGGR